VSDRCSQAHDPQPKLNLLAIKEVMKSVWKISNKGSTLSIITILLIMMAMPPSASTDTPLDTVQVYALGPKDIG